MKKLELTESVIRKLEAKLSNDEIKAELEQCKQKGFNKDQIKEIKYGLEHGIDVLKYIDTRYDKNQIGQVLWGIEMGLDVSYYNNPEFNWHQMTILRQGLRDGLDVTICADPKFNAKQMAQILTGLHRGVDVSLYANPKFSSQKMYEIRQKLEKGLDVSDYISSTKAKKPSYTIDEQIEINMDKLAASDDYFADDSSVYNAKAKDEWFNYSFDEKWNELEAHFEDVDLYKYVFEGIPRIRILEDMFTGKVGIQLYKYYYNDDSKLSKIEKALKGKIEGNIFEMNPEEYTGNYLAIGITPTINNVKNYKAIKKIVDSIVK